MLFSPYLRTDPDPVLRTRALTIERFDKNLQRKSELMEEMRKQFNGVGIAAQQAGYLDNLAIIDSIGPVANLSLHPLGEETETGEEGCLSLPGVYVPVERYQRVIISGQGLDGQKIEEELEGYLARIAQHEYDHLCGVLILDRTAPQQRRAWLY